LREEEEEEEQEKADENNVGQEIISYAFFSIEQQP
jgi:hypothetical protein